MRLNKNRLKVLRILARAAADGRCLTACEIAASAGMAVHRTVTMLARACAAGIIIRRQHTYTTAWYMPESLLIRQGAEDFVLAAAKNRKKLLATARRMRYRGRRVREVMEALGVSYSWVTHHAPRRRR